MVGKLGDSIHLLRKRPDATADGKEVKIPVIRAVAVHFLSTGRNAWHSTWIRRYSSGDFFRDGRGVQAAVEKRKTRGTVFYLTVLPAFEFRFGDRKIIVAEINTPRPFQNVDLDVCRFGLIGHGLSPFLDLIAAPSSLWKSGQPVKNRVIGQEVSEDYIDLTAYTMLARGRDAPTNPALGSYARRITGSFCGESDWHWNRKDENYQRVSLRWYNKALESMMESRERLAHFRGSIF